MLFGRHRWTTYADIARRIDRLAELITEIGDRIMTQAADDQAHLEADVTALGASITTAVAELKAQIAAGVPATALNFATLDALATSTAAEATADAPPAPPVA